ncbi:protein FAM104A [Erpetoichthys calabaricus]|uniref:protein FAM104A n=1 Tax=Erpetoichthys calabaricus TaxID=27687 RepID=UPI00109FC550|nr:protein FAM104A [Erpetoichthys calabaricus]
MLSENRKRPRSCDHEDHQLLPQPKRSSNSNHLLPEVGRDAWDSESSSSESSAISSPECPGASSQFAEAGGGGGLLNPGTSNPATSLSVHFTEESVLQDQDCYQRINRILREAHFHSLQSRAHPGTT